VPDPQKPVTAADFDAAKPVSTTSQSDWDAAKPIESGSTAEDLLIGAAKGAGNTLIGLGELVHKIPGVSAAIDAFYGTPGLSKAAFPAAREAVKPANAAQRVGQTAEQIGEFFVPAGDVGKIGKLGEIAVQSGKNAGLTMAQGGGAGDAAVSAGLTAAFPGAGAMSKASDALESSAERTMVRALGPTKAGMKAEAEKITPTMLEKGVSGSRGAMLAQASDKVDAIGKQLGTAYADAAARGDTILGQPILKAIEDAKASVTVPDAKGIGRMIPGTEPVHQHLEDLHRFVESMGDAIPIDKAATIKRAFDQIVSKAGLYGAKATANSTDAAKAWSTREAANAFRGLINSRDATINDLNKEFSFWKGLQDVLTETEARTKPQGIGLTATLAGTGGLGAGALLGGATGGVVGGAALTGLTKLMTSPAFRTKVSAPLKNMLADALASGNATRIAAITKTILAATPAQVDKQ
jgi:hypothetical protein